MMTELTAHKELDARGLKCPMPVVKTSQAIKTVEVGEVLKVIATDPGSIADINAWCKAQGNDLLQMNKGEGTFEFLIRRNK
jgi:tRNA 2-thiouridine synthesizing protein A